MEDSRCRYTLPISPCSCYILIVFSGRPLFSLEIKVEGFVIKDTDGRKSYRKGKTIKWDVEDDSFSLDLLMESLSKELKWGNNQTATVWFLDKRLGEDVMLVDQSQMVDIFEMYKSEMSAQLIVGVFNKSVGEKNDWLEPLCVVPPDPPEHALVPFIAPPVHEHALGASTPSHT